MKESRNEQGRKGGDKKKNKKTDKRKGKFDIEKR